MRHTAFPASTVEPSFLWKYTTPPTGATRVTCPLVPSGVAGGRMTMLSPALTVSPTRLRWRLTNSRRGVRRNVPSSPTEYLKSLPFFSLTQYTGPIRGAGPYPRLTGPGNNVYRQKMGDTSSRYRQELSEARDVRRWKQHPKRTVEEPPEPPRLLIRPCCVPANHLLHTTQDDAPRAFDAVTVAKLWPCTVVHGSSCCSFCQTGSGQPRGRTKRSNTK